jgi:hypothetical protein
VRWQSLVAARVFATLSLFPRVYLSYIPPTWNATTPPTPISSQDTTIASKEKKEWKRRIKMYCELLAHSLVLPFHPLISARVFVPQWVPLLKRLGLDVLFLARRRLRSPMHARMRVIGTRLKMPEEQLRRAKENADRILEAFGEDNGFDVVFECTGAESCIQMVIHVRKFPPVFPGCMVN